MTSQGYLTAGLAARIAEVQAVLDLLDQVSMDEAARVVAGALVTTEGDEERQWMLLPGGEGDAVGEVTIVSPQSPVGRALLGREEGDEVQLPSGDAEIVALR
ncbi:MAG: hypothetical protein EP330_21065 [Deltaproteobacteria bacterium]|nr:MAG: hypothetical protein EP330_21065 [Deltaproteobacteria bacterium]